MSAAGRPSGAEPPPGVSRRRRKPSRSRYSRGKCRLLIVEDDEAIAALAARYLANAGFQVLGPVATEDAALRAVQGTPPDLVLADIDLADGGDGVRLAEILYARWRIPTLFVSGSPHEAERGQAFALGLLCKPYELRTLLDCVTYFDAWLNRSCSASIPLELQIFDSAEPYRERGASISARP